MVRPWKLTAGVHWRMLIYYSQFENSFDTLNADTREMEVKEKKK